MLVIANASGWMFTEVARQSWIVYGLMQTSKGASPVSTADVALTLSVFVAVYSALAVVAMVLILRAARRPLHEPEPQAPDTTAVPGLVY